MGEEGWMGDEHRPSIQDQVRVLGSEGPTWEGRMQAKGLGHSEVYALPASTAPDTSPHLLSPQCKFANSFNFLLLWGAGSGQLWALGEGLSWKRRTG